MQAQSTASTKCEGCEVPLSVLSGDAPRRLCVECHKEALRIMRQREAARERQRKFQRRRRISYWKRNAFLVPGVTLSEEYSTEVQRPTRYGAGAGDPQWLANLRERREIDISQVPPLPPPVLQAGRARATSPRRQVNYCANGCGRALGLGRYKVDSEYCGTCRKQLEQGRVDVQPAYATFETVARQLADESPLEFCEADGCLNRAEADGLCRRCKAEGTK